MKPIGWYLDKIERGEPVSKRSLIAVCDHAGISIAQLLRLFEFSQKDNEVVRVRDESGFMQLRTHHGVVGSFDTRVSAAIGGNSHSVRVDGSLLLSGSASAQHPTTILFDKHGVATAPRALKPQALIVENLQNFLSLEKTLIFASSCSSVDPFDVEIIWSNGNAINNRLHHEFMCRFTHTWWLVDVDLGGTRILVNALNYLPETTLTPIVPIDIENRLKDHGSPLSVLHRDEMLQLARKYPLLASFLEYPVKLHRQLEQETYLLGASAE